MIHRIFSSLSSFRTVEFNPGLNMLIADTTPESTERETRNALGKSSLIEIIHFLTGGSARADSIFRHSALASAEFGIEMDLWGERVVWTRSGERSEYRLQTPHRAHWPIAPRTRNDRAIIGIRDMQLLLGAALFGLDPADEMAPTFRSMFSYFVRRASDGGFLHAEQNSAKQQTGDRQKALSFMFGLDWRIAHDWQQLREREKSLQELHKAAQGAGSPLGRLADLRSQLVLAQGRADRLQSQLGSFEVAPAHSDLIGEADRLTQSVRDLTDLISLDRLSRADLQQAVEQEAPVTTDPGRIAELYRRAGIDLGELVRRRLDEVVDFHSAVIRNRQAYLAEQLSELNARIQSREAEVGHVNTRLAEILSVLHARGAMQSIQALQSEANRATAAAEVLRQRVALVEQIESDRIDLQAERTDLQRRLRRGFDAEEPQWSRAVIEFEAVMQSLTEHVGSLVLEPTDNGPEWRVREESARSQGVNSVLIYAFDMTLMALRRSEGLGPEFLVHDSHLFDGVDERQRASALVLGARRAESVGFQYIVTMNSDEIPANFDPAPYRLAVELSDRGDDGGLFGFRFGDT